MHTPPKFPLKKLGGHAALAIGIGASLLASSLSRAASDTVSRAEYEQLKKELAEMRSELRAVKNARPARNLDINTSLTTGESTGARSTGSKAMTALNEKVDEIAAVAEFSRPGETTFLLTGSAKASFTSFKNDSSNFNAVFAPVFLWHLTDRLFFEGELEFELDGGDTLTNLEYSQLHYFINDYMSIGAGKFLSPVSAFIERYEPSWINKLPDTPLAIYDGILPEGNVGVQLRGAVPLGLSKINYAVYVSNAPRLITDDPAAIGQLEFNNYSSVSDNKAVGGRVGFQICPNLELGYGAQYSHVQGDAGPSVKAFIQTVDLYTYADALLGRFTLMGEYAWSDVGRYTYEVTDDSGTVSTLDFGNKRNGGYLQASYRGRQFEADILNHLELVVRADQSKAPVDAPGSFNEKRLTFGLDYWLTGSTVLKAAYEVDHRDNGELSHSGIVVGVATGF